MSDSNNKNYDSDEQINKRDLDVILEVNRKAIEIETSVADQNEEIIDLLNNIKDTQKIVEEKSFKLNDKLDELSKDMFKLQVLFVTGLLSIIAQIISVFLHK
jgi:hypothetical protein